MSFSVYLAGGLDSDWRQQITKRWRRKGVTTYDPMTESRQGSIYAFTEDDLGALKASDLLFGYCTYHRYTGMALEFGYAHALAIPIVYVVTQPRIDSMMAAVAAAAFTDLAEAISYCEKRIIPQELP